MIGRIDSTVLDSDDPRALAEFYAEVLGMEILRQDGLWFDVGPPGSGPEGKVLSFQHSPGHVPPTWPEPGVPQQFHLDIRVDDIEPAEQLVLSLGARRLLHDEPGFRVYTDPAGHPFCLVFD